MITRRRFLLGASVVAAASRIRPALAGTPRVKVFGIGGSGCTIVEKLRSQDLLGPLVDTYTVNRVDEPRIADLKLGIEKPLSETDAQRISSLMRHAKSVILVTGLGGRAGTWLTPQFAHAAEAASARVSAVLGLPFNFEGRRRPLAEDAAREISRTTDATALIDWGQLMSQLSPDTSMRDAFDYFDRVAMQAVLNEVHCPKGNGDGFA